MRGRRRIAAAGLVLVMVASISGCWLQPRLGPERQNHLGADAELNAATVAGLVPLWSTEVRAESRTAWSVKAPVAAGSAVYAVGELGGGGDFGWYAGVRVDADTGAIRWAALHENVTLALPMFLDDPVIVDGQLVARYYIAVPERIILHGGDAWDLGTGAPRPPAALRTSRDPSPATWRWPMAG